jgi:signal transduction histidine kinase
VPERSPKRAPERGPPFPGAHRSEASERVLVQAPSGRDAELTCRILDGEGLVCHRCGSCEELAEAVEEGAGLALMGSECFDAETTDVVLRMLASQPVWSDLPLLVLTRESADSARVVEALGPSANLTLLERPVWMANLVTAVQAAVRARRRQYQVRDLVQRLADSDRMKDEFLAMLGHELRNPLNAIATAAAILVEVDGRAAPERQARMIGRQTRHLSRMVDDLLDFSRLSLGKIELRREPLDLRDAARSALETLTMAGFDGRHRIEVRLADEPVRVEGDPVRLEQVIANLLHNSVKYTPEGGHLDLSVAARDGEAVLSVRDDGVGISSEGLDAIFAPFTQLRAASASTGGLGIGLYLARRLANLHDGRLEARSEGPGKGSEFRFVLPCLDDGAVAEAPASADPASAGPEEAPGPAVTGSSARPEASPGALRVLLVEDNIANSTSYACQNQSPTDCSDLGARSTCGAWDAC